MTPRKQFVADVAVPLVGFVFARTAAATFMLCCAPAVAALALLLWLDDVRAQR